MTPPTFLTAGFRVFFLAAGLYAVAAMAVWLVWLAGQATGGATLSISFGDAPQIWHAHEMIHGFAAAAIAGFLLTAVPNWTGAPPAGPGLVSAAAALWLAGRVAVFFADTLPAGLVAAVDLAFPPFLAAIALTQLARNPKPANLMVAAMLALLWSGDLLVHLDLAGLAAGDAGRGLRVGLLTIAALIAIIGGRVTPAFTRNALAPLPVPATPGPLNAVTIAAAIALPLLTLANAPAAATGVGALVAAGGQTLRLAGWRGLRTLDRPILWSLHLPGVMLALGWFALGISAFGPVTEIAALHLIGIGAAGGMILSMMGRATLGHSGRPLVFGTGLAIACALIPVAATLRALGTSAQTGLYYGAVFGAGLLWCAAFSIFVLSLWTPLTTPRAKPAPQPLNDLKGTT
jgi:uncharacterized protein involved in response to NO